MEEEVRGFFSTYESIFFHTSRSRLMYLGDMFDMNANYISRLFKDEFGENFSDYLIRLRIDHAKKMLIETQEPIQSIASQVGYTTAIAFNRVFKKIEGITPGEYRKAGSSDNE